MKIKSLVSLLLAVILCVLTFAACGDTENVGDGGNENVTAKWESGKITAPGDVFALPKVERSGDKAPVIAEISRQVDPGRTLTITGSGFSADTKAYLYSQSDNSNGKTHEILPIVIDDTTVMVTVDSSIPYGVYGVYVKNTSGTSNMELINMPRIWWNGLTTVNAGDEFSLYGENLTTKNGDSATVYIVGEDDNYIKLSPIYADPFKVTIKIPNGLEDGKSYTVRLHNGHGGDIGFIDAPEKITFKKDKTVEFKGSVINVTEFGANASDKENDDTNAIIDAATSAKDGDIIYFPEGTYVIKKPIHIYGSVKVMGDGAGKTNIILDKSLPEREALFNFTYGPVEVTKLAIKDVRTTKITNDMIKFSEGTGQTGDIYNLYVNNCYFVQHTRTTARSRTDCIWAQDTAGVIIKDNKFEVTGMLWTNHNKKLFITDNEYYGTCYAGPYYSQNAAIIWNTQEFDASNNKFMGRDILTDDSGRLEKDDYTVGRIFAIQQEARNLYMSNNTAERTGLPMDNAGEQIMLENVANRYLGGISAATTDSITVAEDSKTISKNFIVTIVQGKGVTQWRYVKSVKGKTITLSEPWDIVPDSTSTVMITGCFDNIAIYNNNFDCFKNYNEGSHTATCGVQVYGNTHNLFIKKNTFKNMNQGVCITSHYMTDKDEENGVYWSYFDDNTISEVACGFDLKLAAITKSGSGTIPMYTSFGVAIRNNTIKNLTDYKYDNRKGLGGKGIEIGTPNVTYIGWPNTNTWVGAWEYAAVIENNTFENCALQNIYMCKHQGGMVLLNNKVLGGPNKDVYTLEAGGVKPFVCK